MNNEPAEVLSIGEPGREMHFALRQLQDNEILAVEVEDGTPPGVKLVVKGNIRDPAVREKAKAELEGYFVK
jgi:hypothetical protein